MSSEPFNEVDAVTHLAMQICAMRLDSTVSGETFAQKIRELVEASRSQGYAVASAMQLPAPEEKEKPAEQLPSWKRPELRVIDKSELTPVAPRKRRRTGPLTDELKDEIRARYWKARGTNAKVPRGFVAQLAADYDLSPSYTYKIIFDNTEKPNERKTPDSPPEHRPGDLGRGSVS